MTAVSLSAPILPSLPATEQLLIEGGDERIALGPDGRNKYGCTPFPDPGLIALGSSTVSGISETSYAAAERLRSKLLHAVQTTSDTLVYARELERMRQELVNLCGLSSLPGAEIVFAASGTDAHFLAAQLASNCAVAPVLALMVEASESGRGVPTALAGHPLGGNTRTKRIDVASVPIRLADGSPRPPTDVDAEFESLAIEAVAQGRRILLVLTDASKTGMIAPSLPCTLRLMQNLGNQMDVLVDACQFRIASSTLRAYLEQNFMVALTGSKFVAGPPFSGVLIVPAAAAKRLCSQPLTALAPRTSRADWPERWAARNTLPDAANFGLLLRWEAALEELRAFHSVPAAAVKNFLESFALAVREHLTRSPVLELLPTPELDRGPVTAPVGWDHIQTIFPFLLLHPKTREPLSIEQARHIHRLLQRDLSRHPDQRLGEVASLRCQLGQPVACGDHAGTPTGALRLCASVRLVVEATANGSGSTRVIQQALAALDKTSALVLANSTACGS